MKKVKVVRAWAVQCRENGKSVWRFQYDAHFIYQLAVDQKKEFIKSNEYLGHSWRVIQVEIRPITKKRRNKP